MALTECTLSAWKIIPHFQSRSIRESVKFYTEQLGFSLGGVHPDEGDSTQPTFGSVFIGPKAAANIYFFHNTAETFQPGAASIALGTNELDEYYNQLRLGGKVAIVEDIGEQWGYRHFTVKDNDGNRLRFFKFLEGGSRGQE